MLQRPGVDAERPGQVGLRAAPLEHGHVHAGLGQVAGEQQPGGPGPDDRDGGLQFPIHHGQDDRGEPGARTPPRAPCTRGTPAGRIAGGLRRHAAGREHRDVGKASTATAHRETQAIPPVRDGAVSRDRLAEQLRAARTRLTVVVAPAGWGKTSLLSGWAADPDEKRRIAWVSLDENDDEPARFWTYVLTALRDVSDDISSGAARRAAAWPICPPVDLALPMLLNELAATTAPHVLVLDDYHVLADPRIHEAVEFLIAYLPRVVAAGRRRARRPAAADRAAAGPRRAHRAARRRSCGSDPTRRPPCCRRGGRRPRAIRRDDACGDGPRAGRRDCSWPRWRCGPTPASRRGDDRHLLDYFAAEVLPGLAPRSATCWCGPRRSSCCRVRCATPRWTSRARPRCSTSWSGPTCSSPPSTTTGSGTGATACSATRCGTSPAADPHDVLERAADWFADHDRIDDAVGHLLRGRTRRAPPPNCCSGARTWFFERGAAAGFLQLGERLSRSAVDAALALSLAYAAALCGDRDQREPLARRTPRRPAPPTPSSPAGAASGPPCSCLRSNFGMTDAEAAPDRRPRPGGARTGDRRTARPGIRTSGRRWAPRWPATAASTRPRRSCSTCGASGTPTPGRPGWC